MTTFTEGPRTAGFLISEANDYRSRDVGVLAAGVVGTYPPGTVLGKITANGQYIQYNPGNADGSQNVAGILFEAGAAGAQRTIVTRDSEVKASQLAWFSGANATQIATATAALRALGIVVRT